jgi:glucokinase
MSGRLAIGVDAGGTKVQGLLVDGSDRDGLVLDRRVEATPAEDAEATTRAIVAVAKELVGGRDDVVAVGVGAAGMVSLDGTMRFAPNLAWRELPLRDRVAEAVGLPVYLDNDANVAAWGEYRFGGGRGCTDMLLVTVGTGIGGGIVIGGRLSRGAHGFGGEIGHIIVEPNGPLCGCGNRGCWEQVAAGRAIGRLGREAATMHPEGRLMELVGGDISLIDGRLVATAAKAGDPVSVAVVAQAGRRLGEGIAGLVNILDPEVVVIGGGAVEVGELLLDPAREAFRQAVEGADHRPEIRLVPAKLGNDAGGVGAADLALREVTGG